MAELRESFCAEAEVKLAAMRAAADDGDVAQYRSLAHGLRSIAANIGARPLSALCLPYETISAVDLRARGAEYVRRIAQELDRVETALGTWGDAGDPAASGYAPERRTLAR